jgi:hypothetical protein
MNAVQLMEIVNTIVGNCIGYAENERIMESTVEDEIQGYDELSIDEIDSVIEYVHEGLADNGIEITPCLNPTLAMMFEGIQSAE